MMDYAKACEVIQKMIDGKLSPKDDFTHDEWISIWGHHAYGADIADFGLAAVISKTKDDEI